MIKPDEQVALSLASALLGEQVVRASRIPFGTQNFVYEVAAGSVSYVLRMTTPEWRDAYVSALHLQAVLLPLGVPVVPFLAHDLNGVHSPFPSLLMPKVDGTDLVNIYASLTADQKRHLANQVAAVHAKTAILPAGQGYGFARHGEAAPHPTWQSFLRERWAWCEGQLLENRSMHPALATRVGASILKCLAAIGFIEPTPFVWDMADRNVLVEAGQLSGIVDVDNLCYGDPLFTVGLASAAFEKEGWDGVYVERWRSHFASSPQAALRFQCYRLYWLASIMRKAGQIRENGNRDPDRMESLLSLVESAVRELESV